MRQITFVLQSILWAAQSCERRREGLVWKRTLEQDTHVIESIPTRFQSNPISISRFSQEKKTFFSLWVDNLWGHPRFPGSSAVISSTKKQFLLPFSRREEKKYFKFQNTYIFYAREISGKGKGDFRWKEEEEKKNCCGTNEGGRGDMRQLYFRRRKEGRSNLQLFEKKVFLFLVFCTRKRRRRHSTFAATENRKRWRRGKRHGKKKNLGRSVEVSSSASSLFTENCVFHYSPPSFFRSFPFPTYTQKKPGWIACELIWWLHTQLHTSSFFNAI